MTLSPLPMSGGLDDSESCVQAGVCEALVDLTPQLFPSESSCQLISPPPLWPPLISDK